MKVNFGTRDIPKLYHISRKNINGATLVPRVPDNEYVKMGIEDGKTPRVSFSSSIKNCLRAIGKNYVGTEIYVFTIDLQDKDKGHLLKHITKPTKDQVPDVGLTSEVWITCPVTIKYLQKIKITSIGDKHTFKAKKTDGSEYEGTLWDKEFEVVKTEIETIKDIFKNIHYGWRNPKTGKPFKTKEEFEGKQPEDVWRLASPDQTIKAEVGNCYDTVALSRSYLSDAKQIQFRTFFMTTADSKFDGKKYTEAPTHTFLIYWDTDDYWKWLEGSWGPFKNNNWKTKKPNELIKWIGTAMANMEKSDIVIYELSGYPKYGCDMTEFESFCRKGSKIMICKPEKRN